MSNIYEIAKLSGYSPSTVARALSGNGYIKDTTKKAILKVAKALNYTPTLAAKSLRNNRTDKILFCIPDICNPFYFNMIKGATELLTKHDLFTMLLYTKHDLSEELKMIELLNQRYGDGMIYVSFNFCDQNIEAVRKTNMPVVLTNKYDGLKEDDNFDYVYVDHKKGMFMATEHLIKAGCQHIALMIGDLKEQTSKERAEGYFEALKKYNINMNKDLIVYADYTKEGGYRAFKSLLDYSLEIDGIITANDLMGIGVVSLCHERSMNISKDIKIVSFDNTDYARCVHPRLSSIDLREEEIGEHAAKLLIERIIKKRKKSKKIYIEPRLVVRESSHRE